MLPISSISPSKIKTYDTCKFKFWLTYYRPDIKMRSNWGAEHGTLIHQILQNFVLDPTIDWIEQLYDGYAGKLTVLNRDGTYGLLPSPLRVAKAKEFTDINPNCDTCPYKIENSTQRICKISGENLDNLTGCPATLFKSSVDLIKNVIKRYRKIWPFILKDNDNNIIGCEFPYKIILPGTDVVSNGFMDLVLQHDDNTIEVIDYKSGKKTQNYQECIEDPQVRIYSLICRKIFIEDILNKGYKFNNILLTFDYFLGEPITIAFTEEEDKNTESFLRKKIIEIKNTKFINRIAKNNRDLENNFKCKYLCDASICKSEWSGPFEV